ncbi:MULTISPECIES: YueI family protein [unclassified Lactobacillus]|uniref:YueI family protein n=1 Tax=unclassified Lactobacillus TaxID=2620435 RepID=UPI000EFCBC3D|nr:MULTISPECIES: YueI family protein [unclassified Lactobacillus]RMC25084.1 DUF1694 domain-containing protein [Lactobacillus sp. ESL0247]RMC29239.1 DUF1694 domain-containing protein [Lactobacillus sp. ESL0246]RMC32259.1 DUF1694 domain-containing protein [Lactobacillus sp. ESL0245]
MAEDLNKRVSNAAQGVTPQTKPDERRRFLGSLRERVFVRMSNSEVQNPKLRKLFLDNFSNYLNYEVLINGNIDDAFLNQIEASCGKYDIAFTLINNETARTGLDETAVVVVSKTAINRLRIEISQVYPPEISKEALPGTKTAKGGFWHRLFHRYRQ